MAHRSFALQIEALVQTAVKRQLSLPVSTMSQWWVMRSSSAVVILKSPKQGGPLAKGQVRGDDDRSALVELADQMEEQLTARAGERQLAELVEHHEVEPGELDGQRASCA